MENNNHFVNKPTRNTCLGFFEVFATILVVFAHIRFPNTTGELVEGLTRFAVPFFFTISGFFLIKKGMTVQLLRIKLRTRIARIFKITLFSFGLYFVLLGGQALVSGSFSTWFSQTFNIKALIELILFGNPLLMVTNWFLVTLLFCYFVIYLFPKPFVSKNKIIKIIVCSLPIWIIVRLIMLASKIEIGGYLLADATFYRTWYATGLPFICFGILLKENEDKLKAIDFKIIYPGLIISTIEMIIANYLFIHLLGDSIAYYCGSIFVVFFIMCLALKKPTLFNKNYFVNAKGNWTTLLYIFHPAVIGIVQLLANIAGISDVTLVLWIEPLIVLVVSLLLALSVNYIVVKFSNK